MTPWGLCAWRVTTHTTYGPGGRSSGVAVSAQLPTGSYAFAGTPESFHPAQRKNGWPANSLTSGRQQPYPDRADFDRDYAGGGCSIELPDSRGSAYYVCGRRSVSEKGSATHHGLLLQIYHGEYHLLAPQAMSSIRRFRDGDLVRQGVTFDKIGQCLESHLPLGTDESSTFCMITSTASRNLVPPL
jgi:hypothetical protein